MLSSADLLGKSTFVIYLIYFNNNMHKMHDEKYLDYGYIIRFKNEKRT